MIKDAADPGVARPGTAGLDAGSPGTGSPGTGSRAVAEGGLSLSAGLRDRSDRVWAGLHAHPFLRELARGVLPLEKFRFFIEQDILYLPDFARCIAMGAAKAATETELGFFAKQLDGTINLELPNQRRVLDQVCRLGAADRGGALGKAPANVAYTSFLLGVAGQGGPLEIMAAILPCAWSYVEIAGRLAGEIADHPVYADWVSFYLTEEVLGLVRQMRESFDAMAVRDSPGPELRRRLAEIFMTSSRLEGAFWDMAYTIDQWPDLSDSRP
jgi:thiaminase/transcriptional activator TenA